MGAPLAGRQRSRLLWERSQPWIGNSQWVHPRKPLSAKKTMKHQHWAQAPGKKAPKTQETKKKGLNWQLQLINPAHIEGTSNQTWVLGELALTKFFDALTRILPEAQRTWSYLPKWNFCHQLPPPPKIYIWNVVVKFLLGKSWFFWCQRMGCAWKEEFPGQLTPILLLNSPTLEGSRTILTNSYNLPFLQIFCKPRDVSQAKYGFAPISQMQSNWIFDQSTPSQFCSKEAPDGQRRVGEKIWNTAAKC